MTERRVGNNLLALGTAAVLAVYAAGYARTEAAAQRVADTEGRRSTPPPVVTTAAPAAPAAPVPSSVDAPPAEEADAVAKAAEPVGSAGAASLASSAAGSPAGSAGSAVAASPSAALPTATASANTEPAPAAAAAASTPAAVLAAPSFPAADSAVAPPWNDGKFYGWGTSRHGDIRAGVEIVDGRIAQAWIEGCYTRYSCSRIADLVPQVADRQNPEVDNVSGATQSSDAFYYGVVEALGHAKQGK